LQTQREEFWFSHTKRHLSVTSTTVWKIEDTRLSPRELFFSSLMGDTVSENDYAHAANVWQRFSIRTLGENRDLYLKMDVLLLADIFENFCESCVASYGLDPAYYYTLFGFTWNAMLKHTRRFELLTDMIWLCSSSVIYKLIISICVHTIHFGDRRVACRCLRVL